MEYSPQDSLETRQSQYMQLLDGYPETKGIPYETLKEDCRINPDTGKRMNDFVLDKAADRNIPADALTGILAASPLVQQMVEDKLPASVVLKELVDMTRNQYTQQLQRAQESIPTIQSVASSAYTVLKTAESALFSVTPLPLQGTKNLIQNVAAPLTITALATKIPGIDQAISTTIGLASSFTSTAFSAIAGNAVAYFGHAAMSAMPSAIQQALNVSLPNVNALGALAGQSIASISNAVSQAVVTGAADKLGQVLGGAGAAVTIGNTAIALGRKISYEVSSKGVLAIATDARRSFSSTFEQSKLVLAKAEMFIGSVKKKITGVTMSQELNGTALNQATEATQLQADEPTVTAGNTTPVALTEEPEVSKTIVIEPDAPEATDSVKSVQDKAAEAYALSTLNSVFGARGIEIKNSQIDYNGETVFKLKNHGLDKSEMNSEAMDAIQKALTDPSNLKGEVRISVGGQTLLHVKAGEVLAGHAFIKESVKVEVASQDKQRYDELSAPIRADGYEKTKQITAAAFAAGDKPEAIKEMLGKYDKPYQDFQAASPAMNERMLLQAEARTTKVASEGKAQERTVERTPDLAMSV